MKKSQFNQSRFLGAVIVSLVIVGVLVSSSHNTKSLVFELDSLSITNIGNPSIFCQVSTAVHELDTNLDRIKTAKSAFHSVNPMTSFGITGLSFTDSQTGSVVSAFDVVPEIKCTVDGNTPITIQPSNLKVTVFSKNLENQKIETWNKIQTTNSVDLVNQSHKELSSYRIYVADIMKVLPEGEYDSLQEFTLTGTLKIVYRDYPTVTYIIEMESDNVVTWHSIKLINDQKNTSTNTSTSSDTTTSDTTNSVDTTSTTDNTCVVNSCVNTESTDSISKFILCASSGNISCLTSAEFLPYYLGGFGLFAMIVAVNHKTRPVIGIPQ